MDEPLSSLYADRVSGKYFLSVRLYEDIDEDSYLFSEVIPELVLKYLLHVNEIPFKLNLDVTDLNEEVKKRSGISFLFVFQYQRKNKASALHSVVRITLDGSSVLEGGATLIFQSEVWDEMSHDEKDVQKSDFAKHMVGYAFPFINGILLARIQDTKLKGLFLPVIDISELVTNIKVEEVPS